MRVLAIIYQADQPARPSLLRLIHDHLKNTVGKFASSQSRARGVYVPVIMSYPAHGSSAKARSAKSRNRFRTPDLRPLPIASLAAVICTP